MKYDLEERIGDLEKKEKERSEDFYAIFHGLIIAIGLFLLFLCALFIAKDYEVLKEILEALRALEGA